MYTQYIQYILSGQSHINFRSMTQNKPKDEAKVKENYIQGQAEQRILH